MAGIIALALAASVVGLCWFCTVCEAFGPRVTLPECGKNKYDVVILLDQSDSVGMLNFSKMLEFAKHLSQYVVVDSDHIQLGLDTFATSLNTEIPLNQGVDRIGFEIAVDGIGFAGGARNTRDALMKVNSASFTSAAGHRDDTSKQLILIIGGKSAAGQAITEDVKKTLQEEGIGVTAVGVGRREDFTELDYFEKEQIHILPTYNSLRALASETAARFCDGCIRKADVLFLLVGSTAAKQSFKPNLAIIKDVTQHFYLGADFIQVGLDVYSSTSTSAIKLGQYSDRTALNDAIDHVSFPGGVTNISLALTDMMSRSFSVQSGHRVGVARIAVLFIAGNPAGDYVAAVRNAKENGVYIIVINDGPANKAQLNAISTAKDDMGNVLAPSETARLPSMICDAIPDVGRVRGCGTLPADIMFLVDTSSSIGAVNYGKIKDFMKEFTEHFKIGPEDVQIGVVTFNQYAYKEFWLNEYTTVSSVVEAIGRIDRKQEGYTNTDRGLRYIRLVAFTKEHGDRENATNILIVITDGQSQNPSKTDRQAYEMDKTNVTVFAVGVGYSLNETELAVIANGRNHVFNVSGYAALENLQFRLSRTACDTIVSKTPLAIPSVTPENVVVTDGEKITYVCNISYTGAAQPTFKWFKNGNALADATKENYTFIASLKDAENKFACSYQIGSDMKSNKSDPVTPKVRPQTPFIVPENATVTDGQSIIYSCRTPRPYAAADKVTYTWMLKGSKLTDAQNLTVRVSPYASLHLYCIVKSPTGEESDESQFVTPHGLFPVCLSVSLAGVLYNKSFLSLFLLAL